MQMSEDKKFYQTAQFKALDAAWKKKLRATGFVDLEDSKNPDDPIPRSPRACSVRANTPEQTQDYYESALEFLVNGTFDSMSQKAMWSMHANGASLREIAESRMISKTAVDYHIQKVKKRMQSGQGTNKR